MLKATYFFYLGTQDAAGNSARSAGWSESWYLDSSRTAPSTPGILDGLRDVRALLLPRNSSIVGYRVQEFDIVTDVVSYSKTYHTVNPGGYGYDQDLFDMALCWRVRSQSSPNAREVILRGIPDVRINTGEYKSEGVYDTRIRGFFNYLIINNLLMRGAKRDNEGFPIKKCTVGGVITTKRDHNLVVNDRVKLLRAQDKNNVFTTGEYTVSDAPDARTLTISDFTLKGGYELIHGRVRKVGTVYRPIEISDEEMMDPMAITREAGRPFHLPRGRR